jgi:hypothetical protein
MSNYVQPWLHRAVETVLSADFTKPPAAAMAPATEFAGYKFPLPSSATAQSFQRNRLPQSPAVIVLRALSSQDVLISDGKWFILARAGGTSCEMLKSHGWGAHARGCVFLCDEYHFVSLPRCTSPVADIGVVITKLTVVAGGIGIGIDEGDSANALQHVCDLPLLKVRWAGLKLSDRLLRAPLLSGYDPQAPELIHATQVGVSGMNEATRGAIEPLTSANTLNAALCQEVARKLRFGTRSAPPSLAPDAPPQSPSAAGNGRAACIGSVAPPPQADFSLTIN